MSNPRPRDFDPFRYYEQLRAVKAYVERNLEDGVITARGAAAAAGVSPGHLAALFRRCADTTFQRWFREFRVARAKKHLATGDDPAVLAVAILASVWHVAQSASLFGRQGSVKLIHPGQSVEFLEEPVELPMHLILLVSSTCPACVEDRE